MKRFRLIFYICYVLIAIVVLHLSFDVLLHTQDYLAKIKLSAYLKFPKYLMAAFLFLSMLMLVEFTLQITTQYQLRKKAGALEKENEALKARLKENSSDMAINVEKHAEEKPEKK